MARPKSNPRAGECGVPPGSQERAERMRGSPQPERAVMGAVAQGVSRGCLGIGRRSEREGGKERSAETGVHVRPPANA